MVDFIATTFIISLWATPAIVLWLVDVPHLGVSAVLLAPSIGSLCAIAASFTLRTMNKQQVADCKEDDEKKAIAVGSEKFRNGFLIWPIFVGATCLSAWFLYLFATKQLLPTGISMTKALPESKGTSNSFITLTGLVGFIYFFYRAVAGAFFATTTLTLEAERTSERVVNIKATIERGDNWLTEIHSAQYKVVWPGSYRRWDVIPFQHGADSPLRLAPKEKTHCQFKLDLQEIPSGAHIVGRVISFPVSYPLPSRSYTKILIPEPKVAVKSLAPDAEDKGINYALLMTALRNLNGSLSMDEFKTIDAAVQPTPEGESCNDNVKYFSLF